MENKPKIIFLAFSKFFSISPFNGLARKYAKYIIEQGHIPFAPHLLFTQFLNDAKPEERKLGRNMGLKFMDFCDELWIFGEIISEGMKADIESFKKMNKPIQYIQTQTT